MHYTDGDPPPVNKLPPGQESQRTSQVDCVTKDLNDLQGEYDDNILLIQVPTNKVERRVSATRTMINVLKGMIGPGCLSLPLAFKFAGIWVGLGLTFVFGALNTHCMGLLVDTSQQLCDKSGRVELDYGHMAKKAVDYGPIWMRRHSKKALYATNVIVFIYQMGVCSVQIVFMAQNLQKLQSAIFPETYISTRAFAAIILVPIAIACLIRSLRMLAYLSMIGNIFMVIGFVIVFQYIVQPPNTYDVDDMWFHSFDRLLLFLGSILYAFEGQAMILPMENEMKHPNDMGRPVGVLHASMVVVTVIYAATGFFGFIKFGDSVQGSITLTLPQEPLYQVVTFCLVMAIFIGLPLNEYILNAMLWPAIRRKLPHKLLRHHAVLEIVFIYCLVLFQFLLAVLIPNLDNIIPLIGITAGSFIALILPPAINLLAIWEDSKFSMTRSWRNFIVSKNLAILLFGFFGLVAGLYANVKQLLATG